MSHEDVRYFANYNNRGLEILSVKLFCKKEANISNERYIVFGL